MDKKWWAVNMMVYLSNTLKDNWNNVTMYTFSHNKDLFDVDFEVKSFNLIKTAYSIRKSDYIIIWNSPMQFVWVLSKILFLSKAKLIWWHHHYPWYYSKNTNVYIWIKKILEKLSIRFIDALVSNSNYLRDILRDIYKSKALVLNPVVDKEFQKHKQKTLQATSPIIFSYARWTAWKNIKQVLDTYLYVKSYIPDIKLLIWGVGDELTRIQNKYESDKNIQFLWLLDKESIIDNLEKSSVFLFSSKIDSFGMTMIESLSCWVPVVAFDIHAAWEIVESWQNWYLVDSPSEFDQKTLSILQSTWLQQKLSINWLNIINRYWHHNFQRQLSDIFYSLQ